VLWKDSEVGPNSSLIHTPVIRDRIQKGKNPDSVEISEPV
jgi:hypothetical protein